MENEQKNIKTYKYKADLSNSQIKKFDEWISLCKEAYNLMIEQRLAAKAYNDEQYYLFHPDKAAIKEARETAYQLKVQKEIDQGKRLPKVTRPKAIPKIRQRHPELQEIDIDVLTYVYGATRVSDINKFKNPKQKADKPLRITITWQSQSVMLTLLKKRFSEFAEVPSDLLAYTCKQVDQAFKKYESNLRSYKPGQRFPLPPKFTSFRDDFSMTYMRGNGFKTVKSDANSRKCRIFGIPKCPEGIKVIYHKPVGGIVVQQAIIKDVNGYYLCVTFEEQKIHWETKKDSVGIDLGVTRNVQLSDGNFKQLPIEQIKLLEKKIANMQRGLRRKELKSRNYYKAQAKIAKFSRKIANIRKYHVSMFATEIARDNQNIAIENLKVKNMTKSASGDLENPGSNVAQKSGLNRSMLRSAPYMFRSCMEKKAKEYGRNLVVVDPKYTSQMCSKCRNIDKASRVDQANYKCVSCGHEMNADHNAAINIERKMVENVFE